MSLNSTDADPNADSYASVVYADAYFAALGMSDWNGTVSDKENALRNGTQYLDNQYISRWIGVRTNQNQSLAWPRGDGARELWRTTILWPLLDIDGFALDTQTVPDKVRKAACEAALYYLTGVDMQPTLTPDNYIKSINKGLSGLSKAITYQDGVPTQNQYLRIQGLLKGLVMSTPGAPSAVVRLMRG